MTIKKHLNFISETDIGHMTIDMLKYKTLKNLSWFLDSLY